MSAGGDPVLGRAAMRAISWRIMPVLAGAYFIASLDRVNVGFAALQMNQAVGLGPAAFGFGAGLFFISYSLFAVPGALAVERLGERRGIALVMLAWGLVSAATAFVQGPLSFYLARFLLGAAEAAFFPSVIVYLGRWLPARDRGRLMSVLMLGLPMASVLGSPLSAMLLAIDASPGLGGWQWLFLIEAAPAVLLGVATPWLLPASPADASWLTPAQRTWLRQALARDAIETHAAPSVWATLVNGRVLALTMVNIGAIAVTNGLAIWQPQVIRSFGLTTTQTGLLNALPFALGCLALYGWGWHSDRTAERRLHTALPLALGAVSLAAAMVSDSLFATIIILCVAVSAASMIKGPFWALATEILPPASAAAAFGQITALTNVGGFVGTYGVGLIREATGSFALALMPLIGMMAVAFACAMVVGKPRQAALS